ncbi:MAG: chromosomal replication initiator protein DnaA [Planctomycetes bacterium]|nr:chromosomal replication initiator protein DnaA [Planctomycetota bacterium]
MPKVDPALWRDIMTYLRQRHAPICRQWFDDLEPVELQNGLLKVHTLNGVQQNYLQRKCLDQFNEAAQATTGALVAVRFITDDAPPHVQSPREPMAAQPTATLHANTVTTTLRTPVVVTTAPPAPRQAPAAQRHDDHHHEEWDAAGEPIVISPDYSFENFVTGPANHLAYAASVAVANQPGKAYNPLFIHGGVGLGKTHLLQAICQTIMQAEPHKKILYLSCDSFMNHFLACVQSGKMSEFRHRYRHVDVLVIDDIHFLANKERSQEEFFHTFNTLFQSGRQIILSSDAPPNEIPDLEDRLVSRFNSGLVARVDRPCYETRIAIVGKKAKLRGITLPHDVIAYIAKKIETNTRELEGAITKIQGHAMLNGGKYDLDLARTALGDIIPPSERTVTIQQIIEQVTRFYNVRLSDLQSKKRHKSIALPRQVCMYFARQKTRYSLEEIGGYFGGRDHTTVLHAIRTVTDYRTTDTAFAGHMDRIEQSLVPTQAAAG